MCIRDRDETNLFFTISRGRIARQNGQYQACQVSYGHLARCLLYTSDAADERSSVDLGGRRIIKKKKIVELRHTHKIYTQQGSQREKTDLNN